MADVIEISGREVAVSSLDKPYFPKVGLTKGDVLDYFVRLCDDSLGAPIMNALKDRPVLLQRYPRGASGPNFFQKRIPDGAPDWLQTTTVETVNGTPSRALVLADPAHVIWAVNLGAFTLHPWPYRLDERQRDEERDGGVPERFVDELRIDLDPVPGIGFDEVRSAALLVRDWFYERSISSFVKSSGSKGLHVYVPLDGSVAGPRYDSYDVRGAAVTVARSLAAAHPTVLTDRWWKEERGTRVFIDFNQNAPHKTVFGAWSVRARVGAQVSTPLFWDELVDVDPDALTVISVPDRLSERGDPWAAMYDEPQDISALVSEFREGLEDMGDAPWPPVYPKQPYEPPRVAPSRARPANDGAEVD